MRISQAQHIEILARLNRNKVREKISPPADEGREADLHDAIISECRRRGWVFLHGSMATATHRTAGEPDFTIAADDGQTFYIECKSRIGKLSPAQSAMKAHLEKLGHQYHVVRSLEEFLEIVQ